MAIASLKPIKSKQGMVSEAEWQTRLELAATYRLIAHHRWTHLINDHTTLRAPGTTDQFLINPYGFLYETKAFNLMFHLEKSCQTQMMVRASNPPYSMASPETCEKGAQQFHCGNRPLGQRDLPALMFHVDKPEPDYAHSAAA